jgi:hypothetical protein
MHPSRCRTTTVGAALALFAALGLLTVVTGPAGAADSDVPWTVRTAANSFGPDRPNYSYTVNPGGQVDDALVVTNRGTTPLDLAVYAADGYTTRTGQFDLTAAGAPQNGVGDWVHAGQDHLTVEPGKTVQVPFTVNVPDDARPGDHLGGIVTSLTQADAAGVDVDRRLALRIRLRVSGTLEPRLSVEHLKLDFAGRANPVDKGDAVLRYTIHNTGNTVLAARQRATVSGPFGRWKVSAARSADSPELLPGETWTVSVPIHGVTPAGRLTARVTLTPLLTDAAGSINPLSTINTTTRMWTIPWALLPIVVLCAAVMAITGSRRHHRTTRLRGDARSQEAAAPPAGVDGIITNQPRVANQLRDAVGPKWPDSSVASCRTAASTLGSIALAVRR